MHFSLCLNLKSILQYCFKRTALKTRPQAGARKSGSANSSPAHRLKYQCLLRLSIAALSVPEGELNHAVIVEIPVYRYLDFESHVPL